MQVAACARFVLLTSVFAGLMPTASALASSNAPVTIIHAELGGGKPYQDWLDHQISRFEALHPDIKIKRIDLASSGGVDKLQVMIAGGEAPDVLAGYPTVIASLIRAGELVDLRTFLQADPSISLNRFIPACAAQFEVDGAIYGLADQCQPWVTFYNADLLQSAGLQTPVSLGSAWDWDTLVSMGQKLTKVKADGSVTQWGLGITDPNNILRNVTWVHDAGGGYFDSPINGTRPTFDTPAVLRAWTYYQSLYTEYHIARTNSLGFPGGHAGFGLGFATYEIENLLARKVGYHWDLARLPRGPVSDGTLIGGTGFQILKAAAHPQQAWQWIKFLATDADAAQEFMHVTGRVVGYIPNLIRFKRSMTGIVQNADLIVSYVQDPNTIPREANPYFDAVTKVVTPYISAMLSCKLAPQEAQKQAQHAAEVAMQLVK